MKVKEKHVLLLDGNTRQVLPIAESFYLHGYTVTTICNSKLDEGYTSKYVDNKLIVPYTEELKEIKRVVEKELMSGKYDMLLPLTDETMNLVTKNYRLFSTYTRIPVPDRTVFLKAFDKLNTMTTCMENNIPCPKTKRDEESIENFVERTGFPLIIKPRSDSGSMGLKFVENSEKLNSIIGRDGFSWDDFLIQEYIPQNGRQYNAHMFVDRNGEITTAVLTEKCRWFPIDGGASSMSRTIHNEKIANICKQLVKDIGWQSYCDIDLIEDPRDGDVKVIEINGRTSANIKICGLAGIDIVKQFIDYANNEPIKPQCVYDIDIRLRCIITDILWFLKSPNRFLSKPSWFSFARTKDQIFSIKDPLPFFAFVISSIPKYKSEMKKRDRK